MTRQVGGDCLEIRSGWLNEIYDRNIRYWMPCCSNVPETVSEKDLERTSERSDISPMIEHTYASLHPKFASH